MYMTQIFGGTYGVFSFNLIVNESANVKPLLHGIIPPMVTPLLENGNLDIGGVHSLINHLLNGGIHGLFILGTTGEGPSLSMTLKKQLVTEVCHHVNKKVPVLVGITDTSFDGSLELAHHAKEVGADYLVVAPPYYFPISQGEMQVYLQNLVPRLPLPFLLYNMPSCTKMNLSLATVKKAKELGAIGIKDSSGNREYLFSLVKEFNNDPSFSIITGNEALLPELISKGGCGTVAGGANFFPSLFVALYEACLADDKQLISKHMQRVEWIGKTIYDVGKHESKYVKGTKSALSIMGICHDYSAPPIQPFDDRERARIKTYLDEFPYQVEYPTQ